jgi:predicted DNA-binding transcriptional regulator YafY
MEQPYKHRIQRLMQIIVEIKTEPTQDVRRLCEKLGISRSQFYKNRDMLAGMGLAFDYSRSRKRFVITEDITLPVENLTISEQLSLVMALRHESEKNRGRLQVVIALHAHDYKVGTCRLPTLPSIR